MENILKDILNEGRINELGSGRDAIKKALRDLNELLGNCISITKQLPEYSKFKNNVGDYMDAVGLIYSHSGMSFNKNKNHIIDALNIIFKMIEQRDKFKIAKQATEDCIAYFNNNYPKD